MDPAVDTSCLHMGFIDGDHPLGLQGALTLKGRRLNFLFIFFK